MNKQSITILLFSPFIIWWFLINFDFPPNILVLKQFHLAPVLYMFLITPFLLIRKKLSPKRARSVVFLFLWLILDVLLEYFGNNFMFELRILSIFLHLLLLISIFCAFSPEREAKQSYAGAILLVILVALVSLVFSGAEIRAGFDMYRFLIIYLPLYRTSSIVLVLLLAQSNGLEENIIWKFAFGICLMFKLLADLVFIEGFLVGSGLAAESYVFLTLTGSFFYFLGLAWLLEFPLSIFNLKGNGITYFSSISQKIPVSLN